MKEIILKFFVAGMLLTMILGFPSCEGSLDDIFGEWSRPTGNSSGGGSSSGGDSTPSNDVTPAVFASNEYKEGSWNGTKVVFEKKSAASPTVIANGYTGTIASGWYTVTGNNVTITGDQNITGDTYLILCDGAKLTINGMINCNTGSGYNLHIYGQAEGNGQLEVTGNTYAKGIINGPVYKTVEIHGGVITAVNNDTNGGGLYFGGIKICGGKFTVNSKHTGIIFYTSFDIYGGDIEMTSSNNDANGIYCNDGNILTVYGGKMKVAGGSSKKAIHNTKIKSGTSNIKFYFSNDNTTWDAGKVYDGSGTGENATPDNRYAKVE